MNVDFVRFCPEIKYDYDNFVVFSENPDDLKGDFLKGYLIRADSPKELLQKLRRAKRDWFVGVVGNLKVLKYAVMRWRVDLILDFDGRELDYSLIKIAKEKDVAIEVSFSKFLRCKGFERSQLFEEVIETLKIIKKFDTPFVLTSGANDFYELRPKRQIIEFFEYLGADVERAEYWIRRLVRRYTDPNYIMDGLEIVGDDP
ncbi:RNase P subunit p30 family protein [Archaeoglobus profundus]|uniref:Ribonuclease P protein component 3 n=1 Tax=Archaeoglobus profundus (strain DSM 5631 / JCM 9629 / NBRC 100127 / Av18) TaxID=572546 RepID=D2RFM5_ARCPA|nr:RNase P subunit p30 family protein [Archaeoglobus profundus]ADB57100.1 RNase P subunit p30 [Archaeoglobus profundus DSM 5631]